MCGIQPKGEKMRQAVKWICEKRREKKSSDLKRLIPDAALRFNLSPKEEGFLREFFKPSEEEKGP
jgi:hypothetical protein